MWESVATFNKQLWNINPLYINGFFFLVWYNNLGIVHNTYLSSGVRLCLNQACSLIIGPRREKTCLRGVCQKQGADQPAHRAVWSAPLFFAFWKYYIQTCNMRIFTFLASLCSWAGWFESDFVSSPEDRFSRDEAQSISPKLLVIILMNLLHVAIWMACQTKCYYHIPLINPWYREEETPQHN